MKSKFTKYQIIKVPNLLGIPETGLDKGPQKIIDHLSKKYPDLVKNILEVQIPQENA